MHVRESRMIDYLKCIGNKPRRVTRRRSSAWDLSMGWAIHGFVLPVPSLKLLSLVCVCVCVCEQRLHGEGEKLFEKESEATSGEQ